MLRSRDPLSWPSYDLYLFSAYFVSDSCAQDAFRTASDPVKGPTACHASLGESLLMALIENPQVCSSKFPTRGLWLL
jgi:hypothetical protein